MCLALTQNLPWQHAGGHWAREDDSREVLDGVGGSTCKLAERNAEGKAVAESALYTSMLQVCVIIKTKGHFATGKGHSDDSRMRKLFVLIPEMMLIRGVPDLEPSAKGRVR